MLARSASLCKHPDIPRPLDAHIDSLVACDSIGSPVGLGIGHGLTRAVEVIDREWRASGLLFSRIEPDRPQAARAIAHGLEVDQIPGRRKFRVDVDGRAVGNLDPFTFWCFATRMNRKDDYAGLRRA